VWDIYPLDTSPRTFFPPILDTTDISPLCNCAATLAFRPLNCVPRQDEGYIFQPASLPHVHSNLTLYVLFTYLGERRTVMSVCVCTCVREYISRTTRPVFTCFFAYDPWPWLCPPSGGAAIRYVLPILWTTSYLHIIGPMECSE